jgi:hypothetical protein
MEKLDLRKQYKDLYSPSAKQIAKVDVPAFQFAMVDGIVKADETPGTSVDFGDAMQALYGISYTLKFASKLSKTDPRDYTVMALEALWWVEHDEFEFGKKQDWFYTAMIMQPPHITPVMFTSALDQLRKKKPSPTLNKLRLASFHEGLSIQVMHIGPYSAEPATIDRMKAFMKENNFIRNGHHHEIYLGDPRKSAPEKLKTVLRQPVKKLG